MKRLFMSILICAALSVGAFTGCASAATSSPSASGANTSAVASAASESTEASSGASEATASVASNEQDESGMFTDRDLAQEADLTDAKTITLASGEDVTISEEGVYIISGTAQDATITVDADDTAKVQLVLDGVSITNASKPAIYVASADKVFVTTAAGSANELTVTGTFNMTTDSGSEVDGVIFAKDDIVLNGLGTLTINSSDHAIVGKDDVKVTGGTYIITAKGDGIQGKDSIAIADGTFTISAAEGIESTYVLVNGGTIVIDATDDGINATDKSTAYDVAIEINGGDITVNMGQGDTDAIDSNGNLFINGGTVTINAQFAFDFDGQGVLDGGTVIVNGEQVTELTNSMMGGGGFGGQPGMSGSSASPQGSWGSSGSSKGGMR